jgi:pimeloyl-ACP methyl ester carboxylesterase
MRSSLPRRQNSSTRCDIVYVRRCGAGLDARSTSAAALILTIPGVGHTPPEERPEEVNAIVLKFPRDIGH